MMIFDERELRKAISVLKPNGQLFEIRVIYSSKNMYSGYFRTADSLIEALKRDIRDYSNCNVYMILNSINPACFDRTQKNRFVKTPSTTGDKDVDAFDWLLVDLDPDRPSGTSSTKAQVDKAKQLGNKIFAYMRDLGFNRPLTAFSGNGVHLLYRIAIKNDPDGKGKRLVEKSLKTLAMLFNDNEIKVDTSVFSPSQPCKLYGTLAQKGVSSEERPHRMSCIVGNVDEIAINSSDYLRKLCDIYPKEEKAQRYNNYSPNNFDLCEWLDRYGLRYKTANYGDGTKYILECCPFDSNHKNKDACIFRSKSGAIGFHCFHNSCADKKWQDVRMLYEPDAYEKNNRNYEEKIYGWKKIKPKQAPKIEQQEGNPIFFTATNILNLPTPAECFIKSGIQIIDQKLRGLKKGYVSLLSGLRAAGKSSLISGICLDCIEWGNNVGVFSGELSPKNYMRWMNLQAAGKGYTDSTQFEGYFNVRAEYQREIATWLGNHFWLYNNEYGNNFSAILEQFEKKIEQDKLDLLILDNLMSFDISNLSEQKYDAQTQFVLSLQRLAKRKNVHILFVAHPRKTQGFLRLNDISGTADLGNAVDNAFIIHRVNEDFRIASKQMFHWKDDKDIYSATNCIEVCKDRDGGIQDLFVRCIMNQRRNA